MKPKKTVSIMNVVAARPNFMKAAPLIREMRRFLELRPTLIHTGQHYDVEMSSGFLADLDLPVPDAELGVGSGTHAEQTARVMLEFEKVLTEARPDVVVVVGDVNSTLACSLTAVKMGVMVAHVEAGLRSRDRQMPEEINRLVTDAVADLLFAPSQDAVENLLAEGLEPAKVHLVGNIMIDTLLHHRDRAARSPVLSTLGLRPSQYGVLTLHRPANVDDREPLTEILAVLEEVTRELPVVFPMHPRTAKMIEQWGLGPRLTSLGLGGLRVTQPMGYLDFLGLMMHARFVLTDSGGIQEETTVLGVPCLTLRDTTERPVTVTHGTNIVVGRDVRRILKEVERILNGEGKTGTVPPLWDGKTAQRIVQIIRTRLA